MICLQEMHCLTVFDDVFQTHVQQVQIFIKLEFSAVQTNKRQFRHLYMKNRYELWIEILNTVFFFVET